MTDASTKYTSGERPQPDGTDVRAVVLLGLGLLVTMVLTFVVVWLIMGLYTRSPGAPRSGYVEEVEFSPVASWVAPTEELALYQEREHRRLSTYGWVDEEAGIAHIPVERAMAILAGEPEQVPDGR